MARHKVLVLVDHFAGSLALLVNETPHSHSMDVLPGHSTYISSNVCSI